MKHVQAESAVSTDRFPNGLTLSRGKQTYFDLRRTPGPGILTWAIMYSADTSIIASHMHNNELRRPGPPCWFPYRWPHVHVGHLASNCDQEMVSPRVAMACCDENFENETLFSFISTINVKRYQIQGLKKSSYVSLVI